VPKKGKEQEIYKDIQNKESNSNNSDSDFEMLNTFKQELDAISTERINGMILRYKAQYVETNGKIVNISLVWKKETISKNL